MALVLVTGVLREKELQGTTRAPGFSDHPHIHFANPIELRMLPPHVTT